MDLGRQVLSDFVVFTKYARYEQAFKRRETFDEAIYRNKEMHKAKFPELSNEIDEAYSFVYKKMLMPSMRSIQFAGKPMLINPARGYNCSYCAIDNIAAFWEAMFLLLSGCGFGYSIQFHHVDKLPEIRKPTKSRRYLVADSIEGWADAIKALIRAYFDNKPMPKFDFSDIRSKGARLITSGGKAPGPEPLKECLFKIQQILDRKENGEKLLPIECHSIVCHISDAVLAGGVRRSSCIALFSLDDIDMLTCKAGRWWELNPHFGRANNSAVAVRNRIKEEDFNKFFNYIKDNQTGEPGIIFTNDPEVLCNPCGEIALRSCQVCNLCEINASLIKTQEELNIIAKAAAFIGTLQASYTDFHYLRDTWKKVTEKEALLGIGITGLADKDFLKLNLKEAALIAVKENERVAKLIGINKAARITTIKPSGTTSSLLGCSSGVHPWYSPYYLRRVRVGKYEEIYPYLNKVLGEFLEDDVEKPHIQSILSIPIAAPTNAITREEGAVALLERVKYLHTNWIKPGHRSGPNTHNVSVTINVKETEWEQVREWMWLNRNEYTAIALLPYDSGNYRQAPFEEISKEIYLELKEKLDKINFDITEIVEEVDNTNLIAEAACFAGACEIK